MPAGFICLILLAPALLGAGHNSLLPQPRQIRYTQGELRLRNAAISIATAAAAEDSFAAAELSRELSRITGSTVPVRSSGGIIVLHRSGAPAPLPQRDEKAGPDSREHYRVQVTPSGAEIRAGSSAGLFYGVQTVIQLVEGSGPEAVLPAVEIDDWPALAYRGVMMDLSHGPLPTVDEIKRQIDFLARWKANQYYFYSELSIELKGYPLINPGGRYSQEQVRDVIQYARERHVDVVPCLEFYGHLHDLFRLERYADLAPLAHGGEINPRNPRIRPMMEDWIAQMAALFPSAWFHVGLDEPWELERAGSAAAGGASPSELYLDHLNFLAGLLGRRGKRMMFWADVASGATLFTRYPDLASRLPRDIIAVPWHYHVEKDYSRLLAPFTGTGVPQVIGTGIWAWDNLAPDFARGFANMGGFVQEGQKQNVLGVIHTNWADDAQILFRATLPGMAYGAAAAWQSSPIDSSRFFADYAARFYGQPVAAEMAPALEALTKAEDSILRALGSEDMFRLWDDPFAPAVLARARAHREDLRSARLLAEEACEHIAAALAVRADSYSVPSLLIGARLIDYAGMKYLYAVEIADIFDKLGSNPARADVSFWIGTQASARNHGRMGDLMDQIGELKEQYRQAWSAQYTPYRLATAMGRFDAEYEYWRRLQSRLWELRRTFKDRDALPPLESLRR